MNNLIGKRFERLKVIKYVGKDKWSHNLWLCLCSCGIKKIIDGNSLVSGLTRSCGCLNKEILKQRTTHKNATRQGKSKTYIAWTNMKQRCNNSNRPDYKYYGKRKIKVCYRWLKPNGKGFINFLKDMGECPFGLSLDRINNDKGYYKSNCRWTTHKKQMRNMRNNKLILFDNKIQCLQDWAKEFKMRYVTLWLRIYKYKWSIKKAFTIPVRKRKQ